MNPHIGRVCSSRLDIRKHTLARDLAQNALPSAAAMTKQAPAGKNTYVNIARGAAGEFRGAGDCAKH